MDYCMFSVLALEGAGWTGGPRFQTEDPPLPPTLLCVLQEGLGREPAHPPQSVYACGIQHLHPRLLCCSPRERRGVEGNHAVHLSVPHGLNLHPAPMMCQLLHTHYLESSPQPCFKSVPLLQRGRSRFTEDEPFPSLSQSWGEPSPRLNPKAR